MKYTFKFAANQDIDQHQIDQRIDMLIAKECPPIKGWDRTVSKGGCLSNGCVAFTRETDEFRGCAVGLINAYIIGGNVLVIDITFNGWLAEFDKNDGVYYSWDGSFTSNMSSLGEVRRELRRLADVRKSTRDF